MLTRFEKHSKGVCFAIRDVSVQCNELRVGTRSRVKHKAIAPSEPRVDAAVDSETLATLARPGVTNGLLARHGMSCGMGCGMLDCCYCDQYTYMHAYIYTFYMRMHI